MYIRTARAVLLDEVVELGDRIEDLAGGHGFLARSLLLGRLEALRRKVKRVSCMI